MLTFDPNYQIYFEGFCKYWLNKDITIPLKEIDWNKINIKLEKMMNLSN